ncbi:MAG: sulfatase [Planctomycetota bacterium]|jgi:arylsulfatase A-like enzyme
MTLKEIVLRAACAVPCLCLSALACSEGDVPATGSGATGSGPTTAPNIILISMDTLRADHLASYGHEVPNSPVLDGFLEGATRWTKAYATAPWTLPSHASMLTGKYPFAHGAHTFFIEEPGRNVSPLDEENVTMAEVLRDLGYDTGAFIANKHFLAERFLVDQGFETFHVFKGRDMARADKVHSRAFPWLKRDRERPYFLFLNYMDTHRPYHSTERPGLFDFPVGEDSGMILNRLMEPILTRDGGDHSAELTQLRAQYDTSVANLDEQLGALFALLESRGELEDTLILITSDHGEYFGEHDLLEHSKDVYQEALHVPFMVKSPRQAEGNVNETPISVASIPGLVFDHLPHEMADRAFRSIPRLDLREGIVAENYYSRSRDLFDRPWGDRLHRVRRALFLDGWKYIHSSDGAHELYHLDADPKEQANLLESESARAASMHATLDRLLTDIRDADLGDTPEYSEEELGALEQLGY